MRIWRSRNDGVTGSPASAPLEGGGAQQSKVSVSRYGRIVAIISSLIVLEEWGALEAAAGVMSSSERS